jgi:lysophospholipid acyltransferase (LPLAT)-like uncharacterized protein
MENRTYNTKEKILLPLLSNLAYGYIGVMDRSLRVKLINYKPEFPVIYAVWHGWQYGLLTLPNRNNIHLLISPSNDGEIISRISNKLGYPTIRGSRGRGGTQALRGILKTLKNGGSVAYTVDGPKGPLQVVKDGIIQIAQMSQAPIIPLVPAAEGYYQATSWDLYKIPNLFSKTTTVLGDPIYIPKDTSAQQKEDYRKQLEDKLFKLKDIAESYFKR